MCISSPVAQTTPTNPAPYPPDEMYKTAKSSTAPAPTVASAGASPTGSKQGKVQPIKTVSSGANINM